jgi:hypothetical protein
VPPSTPRLLRRLAAPALLALLLAPACASVRVSVDYAEQEDFSTYRTFTWLPRPQERTGDYRIDNPLLDERIRSAVERNLAAKGYQQVVDRAPDFYVAYHLRIEEKIDVYTVNRGYVDYWGYYVAVPETRVRQYDEGSLVIDIADARKKQLTWRGVAVGRVREDPTPEQTTKRVDEAVSEILERFPPERGRS